MTAKKFFGSFNYSRSLDQPHADGFYGSRGALYIAGFATGWAPGMLL